MSEPVRLARRVADIAHCSRLEAEQYIKGGWVSVDGKVVEIPHLLVTDEAIDIDPGAQLEAVEPATLLLHKPVDFDTISGVNPAAALVSPATRWAEDPSGVRLLERHFQRLTPLVPLDREASGLMVLTQDGRVWKRLTEDQDLIEQEFLVEVSGEIAPYGLRKLNMVCSLQRGALPPCKVSGRRGPPALRAEGRAGGQLRDMCAQVGLELVRCAPALGKVSLAKMPVGRAVTCPGAPVLNAVSRR